MRVVWKIVKRNALNYLYDKTSIFFSFLSVLIIIFLYVAFLGELQASDVSEMMRQVAESVPGAVVPSDEASRFLVNTWLLAGIITVNSITVPLSILSNMIDDLENKTINDFLTAPISRGQIVLGYLIASWILGIILSLFTLTISQIYIVMTGGQMMDVIMFIKSFLIIILSVISFSSISFFVLSFVKSVSTVGVINTLVGTLIGFLAGIYMPIGIFGKGIQYIIKLNPAAHAAVIFRQVFMTDSLKEVFGSAPASVADTYKLMYGVEMELFGREISPIVMILYLIGITLLFFGLSVYRLSRLKR